MDAWMDAPRAVREGEELDRDKLEAYLQAHLPEAGGDLEIQQFPSGYSNLTYFLKLGERELVLRRPPFGANIKTAHDMGREYHILSHLAPVWDKAPTPLLHCTDETVLGAPFYLMERVRGVILRPRMDAAMHPEPNTMRRIGEALVDTLVELHSIDYQAAGLGELGRPEGYVQRQIEGWSKRYFKAKTDEVSEIEQLARWLADHQPPEQGATLIHNDFKYDNLVLDPADWSHIIAVLDWEMATVGDPLMDLGTSLGYWINPDDPELMQQFKLSPTYLPGNPSREEVVQRYAQQSSRPVDNIVFYYAYGLFKIAVILQQIYYRYKKGYTKDPRFAPLHFAVRLCGTVGLQAVEKQRLDGLFG